MLRHAAQNIPAEQPRPRTSKTPVQDGSMDDWLAEHRAFAYAAAETQLALNGSYDIALSRPQTSSGGPSTPKRAQSEQGYLEVYPKGGSRPPTLLAGMDMLLAERMRASMRLACLPLHTSKQRPGSGAAYSENLWLMDHRMALRDFTAGFATYAPLLSRIQVELDTALDTGLRCTLENMGIRERLFDLEAERTTAKAKVTSTVINADKPWRDSMAQKLQEAEERSKRASRRLKNAEMELDKTRSDYSKLERKLQLLHQANEQLNSMLTEEEHWQATPRSPALMTVKIGPLTQQEEDEMDADTTGAPIPSMPSASFAAAPSKGADPSFVETDVASEDGLAGPAQGLEVELAAEQVPADPVAAE